MFVVEPRSRQHRARGGQLAERHFAVIRQPLVGEVESQNARAEQQSCGAQGEIAASDKPGGVRHGAPRAAARVRRRAATPPTPRTSARGDGAFLIIVIVRPRPDSPTDSERQVRDPPPHRFGNDRQRLRAETDDYEGEQNGVHVPPQEQRRAGFDGELPKAPLPNEYDHPMKRERDGEHVHAHLVGYGVAVVEDVVRRERHERGAERRPSAGEDSRERGERQDGGGGVEDEHQRPRREYLRLEILPEGQHGYLDERRTSDGESSVHVEHGRAVAPAEFQLSKQPEVCGRRQIFRQREVFRGVPPVEFRAVKVFAVAAEDEDRRERQKQKRRRKPRPALRRRYCEPKNAAPNL